MALLRILYHCNVSEGGLAEYALRQASALADLKDVELLWQAPSGLSVPHGCLPLDPLPPPKVAAGRSLPRRAYDFAASTLLPFEHLVGAIRTHNPDVVLLSSWMEYFSPFWAPKLRVLCQQGIRFGAVIHDPVRDYVRGPHWWHRFSVRQAYSFLDVAFIHDTTLLDSCGSTHPYTTIEIPHGPLQVPTGDASRSVLRREFGLPEQANVLLSFGHIRDEKNLSQIILALTHLPSCHLLVAGREQSAGQKSISYYRDQALSVGVADRCHWYGNYIPNDDIWRFFQVSDLLLLLYSHKFRSASGVLNLNSQFELPILASAGCGPMLEAVQLYDLGRVIQTPNPEAIAASVPSVLTTVGNWELYRANHSWSENAKRVVSAFAC